MPWVETNDIETYYHDYGTGQPLVVLHGSDADHQAWAEQLQPLTDEFRVLLYDLRGHGKTGGSDLEQYTVDTYADDFAAFIDALDLDQPAVLGHSFGGMVGYTFAAEHPDRPAALITVGSPTPLRFSKSEWLMLDVINPVLVPAMTNEYLRSGIEWGLGKIFGEEEMADRDELQQLRDAHDCDVPDIEASELRKNMDAVMDYRSIESWQLPKTPLLVLYGENEPFVENHADYLETELDDCQSKEIPEGTHNPQVDNPEFTRAQIREFLTATLDSMEFEQTRSQS